MTHLQNASLKIFPECECLLVERVQRASRRAGFRLGNATFPAHQIHLHVGRRQRAATLSSLQAPRPYHFHLH